MEARQIVALSVIVQIDLFSLIGAYVNLVDGGAWKANLNLLKWILQNLKVILLSLNVL
jgi:hypothetical protein